MELFTVQRYTEEKSEKTNEDEILQKLLQKAAKRKRRNQKETTATDEANAQQQEQHEKKVKRDLEDAARLKQEQTDKPAVADDVGIIGGGASPPSPGGDAATADTNAADVASALAAGFTVLGEDAAVAGERAKVDMVLPPWLAHPTIISTDLNQPERAQTHAADDAQPLADGAAVEQLGYLAPHIRHALKELHVTRLFPVQTAVVPWILEAHTKPLPFRPRDICVSAPTGSGKTLAFAVPIVQLLAARVERKIRALVVLPVAELAHQVFKVFKKLCDKTDLSVCLLSKQFAFPLEQEKLVELYKGKYYSKVDIVVTTPGRLVDHLHATKGFCVQALRFLVIDEADRIMDAVFQNWLYHLDAQVRTTSDQLLSGRTAPLCYNELELLANVQPHKLLFSATLSQDPEKLQSLRLFQPKLFTSVLASTAELREKYASMRDSAGRGEFIGKYTTPVELTEKYCITESRIKPLSLYSLIVENGWKKFLCFTNSGESAARLAFVLTSLCAKSEVVIRELSAAMNVNDRASTLSSFARGRITGLICSDALARGIDIPDVDIVISYDPARHVKTYIHRVGRTARAGRPGTAITLLTQKELITFNQLLGEVGKELREEICVTSTCEERYAKRYATALAELRTKVERERHTKKLLKTRVKGAALAAVAQKDPAQLTLMERFQVQADTVVEQRLQAEAVRLKSTSQKSAQPIHKKKFNASAGKIKTIKQ